MDKFDSKEYSWADITVVAGGRPLTGIRGIKYGEKQEKEYLYAKGDEPHSIQRKNKSYEGEITILQSELEALIKSSPQKSLLNVKLETITIAYAPKDGPGVITVDQIKKAEFTESMKDIKQGDGNMEIALPIMFLRLKQNI